MVDLIDRNDLLKFYLNDCFIKNKINNFLIKHNIFYTYSEFLGKGMEGEAFKIHDYINVYGVIKLTTRKLEFQISNHLKNKTYKHLYRTIDNEILIPNELFLIYKPYYIIDDYLKQISQYSVDKLINELKIKNQIFEMIEELKVFGDYNDLDIHGANLGWDVNNLVHFDIDESTWGTFIEDYF